MNRFTEAEIRNSMRAHCIQINQDVLASPPQKAGRAFGLDGVVTDQCSAGVRTATAGRNAGRSAVRGRLTSGDQGGAR